MLKCEHQSGQHRLRQDDRLLADLQSPQTLRGHPGADLQADDNRGSQMAGLDQETEWKDYKSRDLPDLREGGLSRVFPRVYPHLLAGRSPPLHHSIIK